MIYRELLSYIYPVLYANYLCSQWSSKQRIRLNLPISALYPHFSVLSPFQRFIPISAFYPLFSVLSPFQRFIPISAFYPHFSVLSSFQRFIPISVSAFSFRFRDSVSAFYPYPAIWCTLSLSHDLSNLELFGFHAYFWFNMVMISCVIGLCVVE